MNNFDNAKTINPGLTITTHKIGLFCTGLWLFFMMALPKFSIVKTVLLVVVIFCALFQNKIIEIKLSWLWGLLFWIVFFLSSMLWGSINGYQFSSALFGTYIIRPIIYFIICSKIIQTKEDILYIFHWLIFITFFIDIYDLIYMAGKLGIIPQIIHDSDDMATIIASNFLSIRVSNMTAALYLYPFIIALYFFRREFDERLKRIITVTFLFSIVVTIISGRRALQLIVALMLIINAILFLMKSITWRTFINKALKILIILIFALICEQIIEQIIHYPILKVLYSTVLDAFLVIQLILMFLEVDKNIICLNIGEKALLLGMDFRHTWRSIFNGSIAILEMRKKIYGHMSIFILHYYFKLGSLE